jgi:DNA-binding NarL/FixJ family response regulator
MLEQPEDRTPGARAPGDPVAVRVLVCDDQEVLRHGLRAVLRPAPDLRIVAEAANTDEAFVLATSLRPDVTLVGFGAHGARVRELVRMLAGEGILVVLFGEPGGGSDYVEALRAGARGYVHTTVGPQRLLDGLRAVAKGETVLDPVITGELLHRLDSARDMGGKEGLGGRGALTARQQAVAELVAEGLTNAEIAARLQVSRATIKGHVTVALRRLGLRDRTQLAIHVHRAARQPPISEAASANG